LIEEVSDAIAGARAHTHVLKILFAQSFYHISTSIVFFGSPVLPLFIRSMGVSVGTLGVVYTFIFFGYSIFEPILGLMSDRIGRKRIVAIVLMIDTLVILSYTFTQDIYLLYFISFTHGTCGAGYIAPSRALIADITPITKRGKSYGTFLSIQSFGRLLGPLIGGYLAYNYDYYLPFYISATIMFVAAILSVLCYPTRARVKEDSSKTYKLDPRSILTSRTVIFIASRALPMFFLFYQNLLIIMLKEHPKFHVTEDILGLIMTTVSIVAVVAQYFSGYILDKIGSINLIITGFALSGVVYLGYLFADNLAQIWILWLLIGAISSAHNIGMMVALVELVPREHYGFAMGLYGLSEDIGGMIGSPLLGMIYDQFGFVGCSYFMVFVCYVSTLMVWINMRTPRTRRP